MGDFRRQKKTTVATCCIVFCNRINTNIQCTGTCRGRQGLNRGEQFACGNFNSCLLAVTCSFYLLERAVLIHPSPPTPTPTPLAHSQHLTPHLFWRTWELEIVIQGAWEIQCRCGHTSTLSSNNVTPICLTPFSRKIDSS